LTSDCFENLKLLLSFMKTEQLFSKMKEEGEEKDVFSDSTVSLFSNETIPVTLLTRNFSLPRRLLSKAVGFQFGCVTQRIGVNIETDTITKLTTFD